VSSLQPPSMGSSANIGMGLPANPTGAVVEYEEPKKASILPLLTAIILVLGSGALWFLDAQGVYPFTYDYVNVVGYLLTPFLAFMCVAWDSAAQRAGRRSPWFDIRPGYSKALRFIAVGALIIAVPHILEMGRSVGEWVVQMGIL